MRCENFGELQVILSFSIHKSYFSYTWHFISIGKEQSLNEALYSFHYTLLSHNLLTGCGDRLDLEKQSISLIYGFDAKAKGKLIVYHVNPIFNEDVEKSTKHMKRKYVHLEKQKQRLIVQVAV